MSNEIKSPLEKLLFSFVKIKIFFEGEITFIVSETKLGAASDEPDSRISSST
jgi:hypothetical protein